MSCEIVTFRNYSYFVTTTDIMLNPFNTT